MSASEVLRLHARLSDRQDDGYESRLQLSLMVACGGGNDAG